MILTLDTNDWKIKDGNQNIYTPEEAKILLRAEKIWNCNLSFRRLILYNFDLEKLKKYYQETE